MFRSSLLGYIKSVAGPYATTRLNCQILKNSTILAAISQGPCLIHHRQLFLHWLNTVSNRIDKSRVREVGPDQACAEWLLRNGAQVQWVGASNYVTDYNSLPLRGGVKGRYLIHTVDATESSVTALGFEHFEGCNHIQKLILKKCSYLNDEALPLLCHLQNSLKTLEIIYCWNLTSEGLLSLTCLTNLTSLKVEGLSADVKNKGEVEQKIKNALPQCAVNFV